MKPGRAEGSSNALKDYKNSEEFSALLSIEHAKGKHAGAAEELEKFTITYSPVLVDQETFWSHKIDAGYEMQLFYAGFPIGDPTRRITHREQKSKDENINRALNIAENTLQVAAAIATRQKIPVQVSKAPIRERSKG